ncbi:hypothetical protein NEOLEDRAFT_1242110 [Neolentinus lepideus HHB14362 ss-1]|uniref:Uncharacterized protein n=1 Tax=Neolentinus lepideus HHB14362 ss-1 TaxID=1314782 RepID=A0A165SEK1_9AGAM|nr:hypothetical protein NEOLEDRAFT_1242110 [Neolentinus lepideus HHB14362 ss-1]
MGSAVEAVPVLGQSIITGARITGTMPMDLLHGMVRILQRTISLRVDAVQYYLLWRAEPIMPQDTAVNKNAPHSKKIKAANVKHYMPPSLPNTYAASMDSAMNPRPSQARALVIPGSRDATMKPWTSDGSVELTKSDLQMLDPFDPYLTT